MRQRGHARKVVPAGSGNDWESIKGLVAFDAANGWPFDFALMLVVYGSLRLIRRLLSPFRGSARMAKARSGNRDSPASVRPRSRVGHLG